jgi:hypothetical protein
MAASPSSKGRGSEAADEVAGSADAGGGGAEVLSRRSGERSAVARLTETGQKTTAAILTALRTTLRELMPEGS